MSLAILNPFTILRHPSLDRVSPLDTAVFVLFTSFVGPLFALPTLGPDVAPGLISVFPPPGT